MIDITPKQEITNDLTDTERLDFVDKKGLEFRRDSNDIVSIYGCITVGKGKNIRDAIDAAIDAAMRK